MEGQGNTDIQGGTSVYDVPMIIAAAHELKSPLTLLRQLSFALEDGDQTEVQQIAERIRLTSERALRLTTDLTRSVRLEDSLFMVEPLNPVSVVDEVVHELSPLYHAKGRRLTTVGRRRSLVALANRELLQRVLCNFIDNALHYSTSTTPVEIRAHTVASGQRIRLSVRDYGPAVPSDIWKTINTNLGERAQLLHARPESSGLGMYVAGQFAGVMDATLGATRHRDGASFYIDLRASTQMRLL